ncbi:MAG: amidohydrolase family protein [Proteobacteria bacterium]|nr:amidohydrolase family protein [Cystobacterineae bacterium]MCL2258642.1 amidohydrolase family protein [Cystobacterineae bacterium]MCL2314943.1 amidohydrolase family protein [Pseudomonadota bacterium]
MSALILKSARVIDPTHRRNAIGDLYFEKGVVSATAPSGAEILDVAGHCVVPGFVDLRCTIRSREDLELALQQGYTTLLCPHKPPDEVLFPRAPKCFPLAPLTQGGEGKEMAGIEAGAHILFDSQAVGNAGLMRRAMQYAAELGAVIMVHAEDKSLSGKGALGEGKVALAWGIPSIPVSAEAAAVARDLLLLEEAGGHLHFAHIACKRSLQLIEEAKRRGLSVTADTTPMHLNYWDTNIEPYSPLARIWPPLRGEEDSLALREGVKSGAIDAVVSDHYRRTKDEMEEPFELCVPGGETLNAVWPTLWKMEMPLEEKIARLTSGPARALRLGCGHLGEGAVADAVVLDAETGEVLKTIISGHVCFSRGATL